jgi:hypothetical protein
MQVYIISTLTLLASATDTRPAALVLLPPAASRSSAATVVLTILINAVLSACDNVHSD